MKLKVDERYSGFILMEENQIKEINSIGRLFEHEKSGAKLLYIENEDDNKVFSISFRTPPEDSTGLPHILEHSVLCGSKKFPVKDPFIELAKGSLNTFLNAMTYPDKTMYPVASRNEQDFINLMDVYLNAVFYPNIYDRDEIMKQEGWHYELNSEDDDITYRGVVYNEMKGAFSSPEQILFRKIQQSLFPDTPYSTESGGDPEYIPDLTQEQFVAFHKKYYHPSNSYIYLYGNGDVLDRLDWLDKNYLQHFARIDIDSSIPLQDTFEEIKEVEEEYSISNNENEKDKTFLSYNFVVGSAKNNELHYALDILEYILLEAPGAPLKKALIDAQIGKDVFGSSDTGILQPTFSIISKNANYEQKNDFVKVINNTLNKLVQDGIDKKQIEAAINKFEFKLREADYGRYPKGLMYCILCMESWLYDEDPMIHLQYNDTFNKIKIALNSDYFEKMIQKYLLNNKHSSIVIVKPKKGLNTIKENELKEKLKKYKNSLSELEIKQLVEDTKHLKEYQLEPSTKEDVEKIPLLSLSDINKKTEQIEMIEKEADGLKILYHPDFTNKIGYVNLYFDLGNVPKKLVPYVGLLTTILGKVNTSERSYNELNNEININTGGINFNVSVYGKDNEPDNYSTKFCISSKAFYEKLLNLFELVDEIIHKSLFDDYNRIKEIVAETKSRMQMMITNSGHNVATARAQSYFSPVYAYKDLIDGLSYYKFIEKIDANFKEEFNTIANNLKNVIDIIFNHKNLIVGFTAEEKSYQQFETLLKSFTTKLKNSDAVGNEKIEFEFNKKNEGLLTSGKVQYVAKAGNYVKEGYKYTGALAVLKTIASLDYLWNNVRVTGGAYGCMVGFSRSGNVYVVSYRDPNLKETLNIYDNMYKYIEQFDCDDREMLKYIIGTISRVDAPLTPAMKGITVVERYFMDIAYEDIQKTRDEILSTTQEKVRQLSELIKSCMNQQYICVQGNEDKITDNKEIFNELVDLFD